MQQRIGRAVDLNEVPRPQRPSVPESLEAYARRHHHGHRAMAAAFQSGGYSLKAIAILFGVHYSTVNRAVRRCEKIRKK